MLLVLVALLISGCLTTNRQQYLVSDQVAAEVAGAPSIRFWGDASEAELKMMHMQSRGEYGATRPHKVRNILALSGGGSAGAFGAGLLAGWSDRGDRPSFDIVTGVSAGALIAPFAFVGPEYDDTLKMLFTSGITEKLVKPYSPVRGLLGASLMDGKPLESLIKGYVTPDFLGKIAEEHRKGRRLLVLTTNVDAQRPVIWDMGAIAASGTSSSLSLFCKVLEASASIPGVYPSVPITVESGGKTYSEMHFDGGTSSQVFFAPEVALVSDNPDLLSIAKDANLYLVINNSLDPEFEVTKNSTFAMVGRAYSTFIKSHTRATINSAYSFTKSKRMAFHLSYVDEQVPYSATDPFNPEYMRRLYAIGRKRGSTGDWKTIPPAGGKPVL